MNMQVQRANESAPAHTGAAVSGKPRATIYRMVMEQHICPYGLKALHLLRSRGYDVEDVWLTTREETDAFKAKHGVATTPQTFIEGERIGGLDDLRRHLGLKVRDPKALTYKPVIALFSITALMALAASQAVGALRHHLSVRRGARGHPDDFRRAELDFDPGRALHREHRRRLCLQGGLYRQART